MAFLNQQAPPFHHTPQFTQSEPLPIPTHEIPELWGLVASYCDTGTTQRLSLVNRRIGRAAQKRLFSELDYQADHTPRDKTKYREDYNWRETRTATRFSAIADSGLAPSVRQLRYAGVPQPEEGGRSFSAYKRKVALYDQNSLSKLLDMLPEYSGITRLTMFLVTLDRYALEEITSLPNLEELGLHQVKLTVLPTCSTLPRLKELVMEVREAPDTNGQVVKICQPGSLEALTLSSNITFAFLSGLVQDGGCPDLQSLQVRVNEHTAPVFYEFLKSCDSLEILTVNHDYDEIIMECPNPSLFNFPPEACPNLAIFTGPIYFAARIVPGRPVIEIEIEESGLPGTLGCNEDFVNVLRFCSLSSAAVQKLHIAGFQAHFSETLMQTIGPYFPALESLGLLVNDYDTVDDDLQYNSDSEIASVNSADSDMDMADDDTSESNTSSSAHSSSSDSSWDNPGRVPFRTIEDQDVFQEIPNYSGLNFPLLDRLDDIFEKGVVRSPTQRKRSIGRQGLGYDYYDGDDENSGDDEGLRGAFSDLRSAQDDTGRSMDVDNTTHLTLGTPSETGYARLVHDIGRGAYNLPPTLVQLEVLQSREYQRAPFTADEQQRVLADLVKVTEFSNLRELSFGTAHRCYKWKKCDKEQWWTLVEKPEEYRVKKEEVKVQVGLDTRMKHIGQESIVLKYED